MDYFAFVKGVAFLSEKFNLVGDMIERFTQMLRIIENIVI
jgi:hypothetical protein